MVTGSDQVRGMAGRVTGRVDEANARCHLLFALDQGEVLPLRKYALDSLSKRLARLRKLFHPTWFGPPLIFCARNDQFGVRKGWFVGPFFHQSENVIGVEV